MSLVLSHPMVHPWATIVDGEDSLVVRHANRAVVFRGPGAKALLPTLIEALDGTRTAADIVAQYAEAEQASVRGALDRLAQHNLLVEAAGIQKESTSPTTLRAATALSEALFGSVGIAEIMQRLTQTRIVLLSDLDNASQLEEILRHSGFGCVDRLPLAAAKGIEAILTDDTIVVLAPRRGTAPELAVMNEVALRTGCRWTHVLPYDGSYGVAGPLYLPGETGCYRCFQIRRRSTLEALEQQRVVDDSPESVFDSPLAEWTSPGRKAPCGASWPTFSRSKRSISIGHRRPWRATSTPCSGRGSASRSTGIASTAFHGAPIAGRWILGYPSRGSSPSRPLP